MAHETIRAFVAESNRIEGIIRSPKLSELQAHSDFLALDHIGVDEVSAFVMTVAGRSLRTEPGMNVRVGSHIAPPGGPNIRTFLESLLEEATLGLSHPWDLHRRYENLHPYLDGNGRSGRALWLWQMVRHMDDPYALTRGFLHTFYYQTLARARP